MELPDESGDIECDNLIKRYQRRPKSLEGVCLADFAAWYNYTRAKKNTVQGAFEENRDDDIVDTNDTSIENICVLKCTRTYARREKARIIRSV